MRDTPPVLKIAAHGAHVRRSKASLGVPKSWWTRKLNSFESWRNQSVKITKQCRGRQNLLRTGKLTVSNWNCHKIPISVVCCISRNSRAFWGDQMDPKSACGGPNSILRTGHPLLTQYTASLLRNAQLSQLDLVSTLTLTLVSSHIVTKSEVKIPIEAKGQNITVPRPILCRLKIRIYIWRSQVEQIYNVMKKT